MNAKKSEVKEFIRLENEEKVFEKIMAQVGLEGFFQKRFNIVFNLIFILLIAMPYMNVILAMAVPDHWCHVPGREASNYTLDQWKDLTIPRQEDGNEFSKCQMFNFSSSIGKPSSVRNRSGIDTNIVECQYGWEYDKTWYTMTIPSQENWVCGDELKVTNTFTMGRFGDVIGTFIFGQLADTIGRQPVFFLSLFLLVFGRVMSLFTTNNFPFFLVATFIANFAVTSVFQSPLVISMEVSANDNRAHIAMMQCLGWTAGICILPMIAWLVGDWYTMMLLTSLPCAVYFLLYRQFPESPRWLATKGKPKRCIKSLEYICSVNGTTFPEDTPQMLETLAIHAEKSFGLASLFSSWRLGRNTAIIVVSWVVNSLGYYILVLNVTNMAGNPFINFFWQSAVELPGYILGRILSDRFGRRWTQSGLFLIVPMTCLAITWIIKDPGLEWLCISLVVIVKFLFTMTFYVVYLQAMEIYPTCVRQTGTAFGSVVANGLGVLGPYIVFLGTAYDVRYPYMCLGFMSLIGGVSTAFLPETLHQKLPETLFEAQHFGEDQEFWKFQDYSRVEQSASKEIEDPAVVCSVNGDAK